MKRTSRQKPPMFSAGDEVSWRLDARTSDSGIVLRTRGGRVTVTASDGSTEVHDERDLALLLRTFRLNGKTSKRASKNTSSALGHLRKGATIKTSREGDFVIVDDPILFEKGELDEDPRVRALLDVVRAPRGRARQTFFLLEGSELRTAHRTYGGQRVYQWRPLVNEMQSLWWNVE